MNYLNERPVSIEVWGRQAPHEDKTGDLNTRELMKKDSVMVSGGAKVRNAAMAMTSYALFLALFAKIFVGCTFFVFDVVL